MLITIDGPAGSGKSTVAKLLSKELGFVHFNSGSIFRAITAYLLENKMDLSLLKNIDLKVKLIQNNQHVYINNVDYTPILRNNVISVNVAKVSLNEDVQKIAQNCMKNFCANNNVVIDGRGLGNSVLTNANFKFYLDCSVKIRTKRRYLEEIIKNPKITLKEIEKQIIERDTLDKSRKIAPLAIAKDAIIINSSNLSIDEVVNTMLKYIKAN